MNGHLAPATTVPAEITAMADVLTGFHPALDRAVAALTELAFTDLDADTTQSVIAAIGAYEDANVASLIGMVLRHLANPDTNPALANLPTTARQDLRRLGAEYAATADNPRQQQTATDAAAVIYHDLYGA